MENILDKISELLSNKSNHDNPLYEELTQLHILLSTYRKTTIRQLRDKQNKEELLAGFLFGMAGVSIVNKAYENAIDILLEGKKEEEIKVFWSGE